ncbi:MAG: EAL domain-containing protein [Raoultibacter sp.]
MKRTGILTRAPHVIAMLVIAMLFVSVVALMGYVQNLLNSDVRINLTEIVTQNKDVIVSKLQVEINNLDLVANQVADKMIALDAAQDLDRAFKAYVDSEAVSSSVYVASKTGEAFFPSGKTFDIAGRKYFQLAIEGDQNISDRLISRVDGEEVFVISVPLRINNAIVGTVQKLYTPEEMYELCSVSLFSDRGFLYIINSDGYTLISSTHNNYNQESENYFRSLYAQGNQAASQQLQSDLQEGKSGFMETEVDGVKLFSAYTPIENVHDWCLISSVPTNAVSPNADSVIKIFYVVLFVVVLISAACMILFLSYKRRQQKNLEQIAFVDPVTGGDTYNKFVVDYEATLKAHPETPFSLLAFDIDNFKYLNSYYGFEYGDAVLSKIIQTLSPMLLPSEHIARMSSDHFVMLLEDADEKRLDALMEAVRTQGSVVIYISAGLYPLVLRTENIGLMIDKATTAARAVKGSLQTRVEVYSKEYDELLTRNERMKRAIERAMSDDELTAYYQPKVDIHTGKLVGAEALVRWVKSDGTVVFPGDFIPLCEQTGLVVDVDMVVLEKVLRFLRKRLDEGIACVPVSVNFSRLHLLDRTFIDKVMEKLQDYEVPANLIEVELTESVIVNNNQVISDFVAKLHRVGLSLAMDDFGSGYSSLNMLKDISVDVLKIDQGFLQATSNSDRQAIIFDTVARMADRLRIGVVVEGVETAEHVRLMKLFGCSVAQGYYFAKPMDEQSFEEIYKEGKI